MVKVCTSKTCTKNWPIESEICTGCGSGTSTIKTCAHPDGCNKWAVNAGLCVAHGAKVKSCSHTNCTKWAVNGGVCITHGATVKRCTHPSGCSNGAIKGGVCMRHGAKLKLCNFVGGCTNYSLRGGVCMRHGAKKKLCNFAGGCTKYAQRGGLCKGHGSHDIRPSGKSGKASTHTGRKDDGEGDGPDPMMDVSVEDLIQFLPPLHIPVNCGDDPFLKTSPPPPQAAASNENFPLHFPHPPEQGKLVWEPDTVKTMAAPPHPHVKQIYNPTIGMVNIDQQNFEEASTIVTPFDHPNNMVSAKSPPLPALPLVVGDVDVLTEENAITKDSSPDAPPLSPVPPPVVSKKDPSPEVDTTIHSRPNKFVLRLHDMLVAEQGKGFVEWRRGLLILHATNSAFTGEILPKYFGTSNYKTFTRQLNYYGFLHLRSFQEPNSSLTTALWANQVMADTGTDEISSVLKLQRVEPNEFANMALSRRERRHEATSAISNNKGPKRQEEVGHAVEMLLSMARTVLPRVHDPQEPIAETELAARARQGQVASKQWPHQKKKAFLLEGKAPPIHDLHEQIVEADHAARAQELAEEAAAKLKRRSTRPVLPLKRNHPPSPPEEERKLPPLQQQQHHPQSMASPLQHPAIASTRHFTAMADHGPTFYGFGGEMSSIQSLASAHRHEADRLEAESQRLRMQHQHPQQHQQLRYQQHPTSYAQGSTMGRLPPSHEPHHSATNYAAQGNYSTSYAAAQGSQQQHYPPSYAQGIHGMTSVPPWTYPSPISREHPIHYTHYPLSPQVRPVMNDVMPASPQYETE